MGYAGQIAIGWVSMLTLGAYTTAALAAGRVGAEWHPYLALAAGGVMGAMFGVVVGLPALRLRTFYFAMTTLGFATIVTQVALAWKDVTGGGVGTPGPAFPWPFEPGWGFYYFCFILAALATWMTANIGSSRYGRALVAIRDAEVAAEASGIAKPKLLILIFLLAGALGGVAGGLFASLQSYITPDAFTFEMSVLFFIAILIGGRGSILGPALGTIILTALPEFAAPLVQWSTFLYAALLLLIVLLVPGGIADLLDFKNRRPLTQHREIVPRTELLKRVLDRTEGKHTIALKDIALHFGGVRAIDGLDLDIHSGEVHGLIGPNGSGKTTTLNVISGYYKPKTGTLKLDGADLPFDQPHARANYRIARTFQTPRLVGAASVLENVMIGGTVHGQATFAEAMLSLPRNRRDEKLLRAAALQALATVGLENARRRARRPPAAQRTALHGDRPRPDAAAGLPDARRAGGRPVGRGDPPPRQPHQGDQPRGRRRAAGRASCRPDLRHLRSRDRAQPRQDAGRGHAQRDPLAPGGGQCLPRRLTRWSNRCSRSAACRPATARSAC